VLLQLVQYLQLLVMDQNEVEVSGKILVILCYNLILVYRRRTILKAANLKNLVKTNFYVEDFYHSQLAQVCVKLRSLLLRKFLDRAFFDPVNLGFTEANI